MNLSISRHCLSIWLVVTVISPIFKMKYYLFEGMLLIITKKWTGDLFGKNTVWVINPIMHMHIEVYHQILFPVSQPTVGKDCGSGRNQSRDDSQKSLVGLIWDSLNYNFYSSDQKSPKSLPFLSRESDLYCTYFWLRSVRRP